MRLVDLPGIDSITPVGVVQTTHGGDLEGCEWLAVPMCNSVHLEFLQETGLSDDPQVCAQWWDDEENHRYFGKGTSPDEALGSLLCIWYPLEDEEEVDLDPVEMIDARRDAMTLIASYAGGVRSGDLTMPSEIQQEILGQWEDGTQGDISSLVTVLTGLSYHLITLLATEKSVEPEVIIQAIALNMEAKDADII